MIETSRDLQSSHGGHSCFCSRPSPIFVRPTQSPSLAHHGRKTRALLAVRWVSDALRAVPAGHAGHGGAPIRAFVCSREGLEASDLMLGWIPMLTEPSPRGPRISAGRNPLSHPMRPESKGQIHITAADPRRATSDRLQFHVVAVRC
jgi:hypothetical protein